MESIQFLTIGLPFLLRELVSNELDKRGSKIIGHYLDLAHFLSIQDDFEPSVIIIESATTCECQDVLCLYPLAQIVSVENSGKYFNIWKMLPEKQTLGEVSSFELVDKILSDIK